MKSPYYILLVIFMPCPYIMAAEPRYVSQPNVRVVSNAKLLETYDADKDGKLGNDEIAKIGRDRLMQNDLNHDGRLDEAELKVMRAKSRQMTKQDELSLAMAREKAMTDERAEKARVIETGKQSGKAE